MRFKFSFLAVLLISVLHVFAQQTKTVTGKVTDAKTGEALPGVTIKAGNSNILTQTTADGSFSINVPSATPTLIFSSVGYADAEVAVTSTTMDVKLTTSEKSLNEVVVVGYGQAVKRD
ncbi:MAG TPA: carboxypeptidase-like regulatory domain-containing protein, partial [Parafilimonas sp.]|nr:carboxypeptidase-like regulatory domain-containing protein [Parafilimonas sp.]